MKKFLTLLVAAIVLFGMACSKSGTSAPAPAVTTAPAPEAPTGPIWESTNIVSAKDSMMVIMTGDTSSFDPADNVGQNRFQTLRHIFETVVEYDQNGQLVPWLAESWTYPNDLTLELHLRHGVKFNNGEDMKASDVLFSFKRLRDDNTPAAMQVAMVDFTKSSCPDDYTVVLVTTDPYAMQLAMLENPLCGIISEKAYKASGGGRSFGNTSQPVGTGPYMLVNHVVGDSSVLKANPHYWIKGQPYVKNVTIRYIGDQSARLTEAMAGNADIVYDIGATDIATIKRDSNINLISKMGANTSLLTLNQASPPLDNIKVREAIFYAVDIPATVKVAYGTDFGGVATSYVSPNIDGYDPNMAAIQPKQDIARAKQCLVDAGFPNGFNTSISCMNTDQARQAMCEALQAQLALVGIKCTVDVQDSGSWNTNLAAGKGVLSIYGFTASTGEAGRNLFRWLPDKSEWPIFSWKSQEYYDVINKALITTDHAERNRLYAQCQQLLMKNYVALPVWNMELNAACKLNVKGFWIQPAYQQHMLQFVYFI